MIRKFTTYLLACAAFLVLTRCNEDEASSPPRPSFTVDKTSGLANDTEFTFTIPQINAEDIALLPYGRENTGMGGILISPSSFVDGKAVIVVKYDKVGTFNAIVVSTNADATGESVKRSYSEPVSITITSDQAAITAFKFKDSEAEIDEDNNTISLTVPYGTDIAALKAEYSASPFTEVTVGGTVQKSGETANNFANPVVYTVKANNGTTNTYTVTVNVTPVETTTDVESMEAKNVGKVGKDKVLAGYVDNDANFVVFYDTLGSPADRFDSLRVAYSLEGDFAKLKYGGKALKQDSLLNLSSSKTVTVFSQDSTSAGGIVDYKLYAVAAPKLTLAFNALNPDVTGTTENFDITLKVLKGTDVQSIVTTANVETPAGVTVTGIKANGDLFASGTAVDYSEPAKFEITVLDANLGGITYTVTYTASAIVLE